jgi:hypothetical protein
VPSDLVGGDVVWLMHLGVAAAAAEPARAPVGMLGGAPLADPARPADITETTPVLRYSDRGWIGEESDAAAPNVIYPARMIEPPALEYAVPVLPEGARRRAFVAGEILLANGDGTLDSLAGNWSVGGQAVTILRGPHTRPRHAALSSFVTVASLRAGGPASGTTRLRLPLLDASGDLGVPVSALYGGTGGADGDADLEGQPKPMLYGIKRRFEPVLINAATSIYQIHAGVISAVLAVRDRGAAYTFEADVANYAALAATMWAISTVADLPLILLLSGAAGFLVLGAQYALYGIAPGIYPADSRAAAAGAQRGLSRRCTAAGAGAAEVRLGGGRPHQQ